MAPDRIRARLSPERRRRHEARGEWPQAGPWEALERSVAREPEAVLFVEGDRRWAARSVAARAVALSAELARHGIRAGDVVSWQLPNWIEGVLLVFALDRLGAISNPILPIFREREVAFIVRQAASRALVVPGVYRGFDHRQLARTVARAVPELECVLVARAEPLAGQRALRAVDGGTAAPPVAPEARDPHRVRFVFYTSGTSSEPKGVLHTASTLGSFVRIQAGLGAGGRDQVSLLTFPLTHVGGVAAAALGPVFHGGRTVLLDPFDPERALDLIEREGVTSAGGPTPILQALLSCPAFRPGRLRSVRVAGIGAADVPPELVREVGRRFGAFAYRSYGLTECPMATAGRRGDPPERIEGTDGRAAPGVSLRIVDQRGRALPPGAEGEVELSGPQLCVGYLDGALSGEAFTPDGMLRTGDLGVLDEQGFLRITGRRKDIIVRKGENLSAKAIEDELHEHPGIAEVAVIGVPDAEAGERVCACVVPAGGAGEVTLEEVRGFMVARGVMRQKIPERIEIVDALPRNATGKVRKAELREWFARGRP